MVACWFAQHTPWRKNISGGMEQDTIGLDRTEHSGRQKKREHSHGDHINNTSGAAVRSVCDSTRLFFFGVSTLPAPRPVLSSLSFLRCWQAKPFLGRRGTSPGGAKGHARPGQVPGVPRVPPRRGERHHQMRECCLFSLLINAPRLVCSGSARCGMYASSVTNSSFQLIVEAVPVSCCGFCRGGWTPSSLRCVQALFVPRCPPLRSTADCARIDRFYILHVLALFFFFPSSLMFLSPLCLFLFQNHVFCMECIHQWSKNESSCPVCRVPFKRIIKTLSQAEMEAANARRPVSQELCFCIRYHYVVDWPSFSVGRRSHLLA